MSKMIFGTIKEVVYKTTRTDSKVVTVWPIVIRPSVKGQSNVTITCTCGRQINIWQFAKHRAKCEQPHTRD